MFDLSMYATENMGDGSRVVYFYDGTALTWEAGEIIHVQPPSPRRVLQHPDTAKLRVLCDAITQYVENSEECEGTASYAIALQLQDELNALFVATIS